MRLGFQLAAQMACRYAVLTRRLAPPRLGGTPFALGRLSICPPRSLCMLRLIGHGPRYLYVRHLARGDSVKLTWDDLLIQGLDPQLAAKYLAYWNPLLPSMRYRVIFLNRLGEWFLQTEDEKYCRISVLFGTQDSIADTDAEFVNLVHDESWQIENLWSLRLLDWKSRGIVLGASQVCALMPHPSVNGGIISDKIMAMDLAVWQWISAQSLGFVA